MATHADEQKIQTEDVSGRYKKIVDNIRAKYAILVLLNKIHQHKKHVHFQINDRTNY